MASLPDMAQRLIDAQRRQGTFIADPASGPGTPAQAYMVQGIVWQALAGAARPQAWKVGASRLEAEPLAAPVLPERLQVGAGHFSPGLFPGGVKVEAEIAVRFARALPSGEAPRSRAHILAAIGSVHVAMELVSSRLADTAAAGPLWGLADNLYNGALVLGDGLADWPTVDWAAQAPRIVADGRLLAGPSGRPPLDDLFHCLAWWIDHVGGARPGDIVTTGAWNGAHAAGAARDLRVEFPGLGQATAILTA
ncbi:MAG: fumarylacetoacetate hydrolase family protein [Pseudomonadota bacterium]